MAETIVFIDSSLSASATSFCTFATPRLQSRLPDLDPAVAAIGLDLLAVVFVRREIHGVLQASVSTLSCHHIITGWASVIHSDQNPKRTKKKHVSPYVYTP